MAGLVSSGLLLGLWVLSRSLLVSAVVTSAPLLPGSTLSLSDPSTTSPIFFNPTPSLSIPGVMTTTTAAGGTDNVVVLFTNAKDTTVCGSDAVSWVFSGSTDNTLVIAITNVGVVPAPTTSVTQLLAEFSGDELAAVSTYVWSPVNVPAGQYLMAANVPETGQTFVSQQFSVVEGDDDSCLPASTSTTSTSAATDSSTDTAALPTGSSSSSSSTDAPAPTDSPALGAVASSSHKMSSGAAAGLVLGLILLFALLGAIFLYWRRRREVRAARMPESPRHRRGGSGLSGLGGYFEKRQWPTAGGGHTVVHLVRDPQPGSYSPRFGGSAPAVDLSRASSVGTDAGVGTAFAGEGIAHTLARGLGARHLHDSGGYRYDIDAHSFTTSLDEEKRAGSAPVSPASTALPYVLHRPPHVYRDSEASLRYGMESGASVVNYSLPRRAEGASTEDGHEQAVHDVEDPFSDPRPAPSPPRRTEQLPVALFSSSQDDDAGLEPPRQLYAARFPQNVSTSDLSLRASTVAALTGAEDEREREQMPPRASHARQESSGSAGGGSPDSPSAPGPGKRTRSARKPVPTYQNASRSDELLPPPLPVMLSPDRSHTLAPPSMPTSARSSRDGGSGSVRPGSVSSGTTTSGEEDPFGVYMAYADSALAHTRPASSATGIASSGGGWSSTAAVSHSSGLGQGGSSASGLHLPYPQGQGQGHPPSPVSPTSTVIPGTGTMQLPRGYGFPELNHKSSFGDRQMHVLMPDPPADLQDRR